MSSEEEPVAWLRQRIRERLYLARHAIELGNAAEWIEQSSGVLVTGEPTETDTWHGTWPMGDSSLTRLMEANDPQDTIARCEAELALIADLLAETHFLDNREWYGCRAIDEDDKPTGCECTCGRDESVKRRLRLLASGYQHRPGYREEDWKS